MKAEHRKELETNVLADRMGKLVQKMKTRPQRRSVMYVVIALAIIVAGVLLYRLQVGSRQQATQSWVMLNRGEQPFIERLAGIDMAQTPQGKRLTSIENPTTNPAKGARLTVAHYYAWEKGVRRLGQDSLGALRSLTIAESMYESVLKESEGDPDFEPECRYNLAVIEETRAVQNQDHLKTAQKMFEEVGEKFAKSGYGELARKRAQELKDNQKEYLDIYKEIQRSLVIPDERVFENKLVDPKKLPPPAPPAP